VASEAPSPPLSRVEVRSLLLAAFGPHSPPRPTKPFCARGVLSTHALVRRRLGGTPNWVRINSCAWNYPTSDARPATAERLRLVGKVVAPRMDQERAAREIG
jgi:hypothetical protein